MKKIIFILLAFALIMGKSKAQTNNNNVFGANVNYQTGTIILTSVNAVLTALNASGITPKWQTQYVHYSALATGAIQVAYGLYKSGANLSTLNLVNIGAGSATIITNAILLYTSFFNGGKKKTSWNIIVSPVQGNGAEYGVRVVKYFKI